MRRIDLLRKRQVLIKEQINNNLDLLMGTVVRAPSMMYHSLTTKIEGKTVTRYVRKGLVLKVKIPGGYFLYLCGFGREENKESMYLREDHNGKEPHAIHGAIS